MDLLDSRSNGGGDGVSVAVEHIDNHRPTLEFLAGDARFSREASVVRHDGGHVAQRHSGSGFDEASVADHLLDLVDFLMAFACYQEWRETGAELWSRSSRSAATEHIVDQLGSWERSARLLDFVRGCFSPCL